MPNEDYIKRSETVARLTGKACCVNSPGKVRAFATAINVIETTPAADVEPKRKSGRWIAKKKNLTEGAAYMIPLTIRYFVCSLCGREEDNAEPYCNCGAKMDAEPPKEEEDVQE